MTAMWGESYSPELPAPWVAISVGLQQHPRTMQFLTSSMLADLCFPYRGVIQFTLAQSSVAVNRRCHLGMGTTLELFGRCMVAACWPIPELAAAKWRSRPFNKEKFLGPKSWVSQYLRRIENATFLSQVKISSLLLWLNSCLFWRNRLTSSSGWHTRFGRGSWQLYLSSCTGVMAGIRKWVLVNEQKQERKLYRWKYQQGEKLMSKGHCIKLRCMDAKCSQKDVHTMAFLCSFRNY